MHNMDAVADFTGTKEARRVGVRKDSSASTATFFLIALQLRKVIEYSR